MLVTHCKSSHITRCKFCSLLVLGITNCHKSLVTCCIVHPLLAAEVLYCKTLLVTRSKIRSFLVAKKVTCFLMQSLLVAKDHSLLFAKWAGQCLSVDNLIIQRQLVCSSGKTTFIWLTQVKYSSHYLLKPIFAFFNSIIFQS